MQVCRPSTAARPAPKVRKTLVHMAVRQRPDDPLLAWMREKGRDADWLQVLIFTRHDTLPLYAKMVDWPRDCPRDTDNSSAFDSWLKFTNDRFEVWLDDRSLDERGTTKCGWRRIRRQGFFNVIRVVHRF